MRFLSDLLANVPAEDINVQEQVSSIAVEGITADSRKVAAGFVFAALKGQHVDGAKFIASAKEKGAVAILCGSDCAADMMGLPVIRTDYPTRVLALMAAVFYTPQPEHIVAITGTDGKTSTADFCRKLWFAAGMPSASVGTLGMLSGDGTRLQEGTHTTPQPVELHQSLQMIAKKGINHVAMEASSHGLHQNRLDGVALSAAAFTNFGRDHLDYHETVEAYFQAKLRLFTHLLPEGKTAVLPADDARFDAMAEACKGRNQKVVSFGRAEHADLCVLALSPQPHGQDAKLRLFGKAYDVHVPLVGEFQVMNILTAIGLITADGLLLEKALAGIEKLSGVPGRLEQVVRLQNGAAVYIDYAHTPLALANILRTMRPHTQNKLHVVFGCGGDRDPGKRAEMGRIAQQLADVIIVTDDNPRSESPDMIRKAIMMACESAKEVADRREAIYVALQGLEEGDVLVIAGKGHETYQIVGTETFPFDDAQVVREGAQELDIAA